MKKLIYIPLFVAAILFVACKPQSNGDKLQTLIAQRDSLKKVHKEIGKELKSIDYQISELDTMQKVTLVSTITIEPKTFEHYFDVRGNIEAEKNSDLFPETMGNVLKIHVTDGAVVRKGQKLLVLDAAVVDNQIKQTESSLALATSIYEKQKSLHDQNIGSEVQFLEAKANKESLESALQALKAQQKMATITAPFDGIVDKVFPKIGTMVSPNYPVVRMVNLDKIYINADVSESYISKIDKGTPVMVNFPTLDKEISSKIAYAGNYINPNNRTFNIRLDIANTANKLYKPNMISVLKILDYRKENAIVLPASIVLQDAQGNDYVFVTTENGNGSHEVVRMDIKTGHSYMGEVEVLEGLTGSEEIVNKGARIVKDGQKVRITTQS